MNLGTGNSAITIKGISKKFRRTQALDDVTLQVPTGTVFALLGENGAGKTTLIRSILGLETPDTGSVDVLGMDPARAGLELRRKIGYVADSPALYEWMTIAEIGWFAAGFYPEGYQENYQSYIQRFKLSANEKVKNLSRGMRAKVNLSLALAHEPDLIIMDEPTSGLDTVVRRRFLESMIDIAAEGRTVLLASHQIPEVERVADIVAIVNQGKVQLVERLESLKARMEWWTVLLKDGNSQLPNLGLKVLLEESRNRVFKLLVDSASSDQLCRLREHDWVQSVEVDVPSLEEIFVAYIDDAQSSPAVRQPADAILIRDEEAVREEV